MDGDDHLHKYLLSSQCRYQQLYEGHENSILEKKKKKEPNVALAKSSNYLNKTKQILFETMYSSEGL